MQGKFGRYGKNLCHPLKTFPSVVELLNSRWEYDFQEGRSRRFPRHFLSTRMVYRHPHSGEWTGIGGIMCNDSILWKLMEKLMIILYAFVPPNDARRTRNKKSFIIFCLSKKLSECKKFLQDCNIVFCRFCTLWTRLGLLPFFTLSIRPSEVHVTPPRRLPTYRSSRSRETLRRSEALEEGRLDICDGYSRMAYGFALLSLIFFFLTEVQNLSRTKSKRRMYDTT